MRPAAAISFRTACLGLLLGIVAVYGTLPATATEGVAAAPAEVAPESYSATVLADRLEPSPVGAHAVRGVVVAGEGGLTGAPAPTAIHRIGSLERGVCRPGLPSEG